MAAPSLGPDVVCPVTLEAVRVRNLAGCLVTEVYPPPDVAEKLGLELERLLGTPKALLRLLHGNSVLENSHSLEPGMDVTFIVDESPLFKWDIQGNPQRSLLSGDGAEVIFEREDVDYVNVITQEPLRSGVHYFEFVMHCVKDEQWCGLTPHHSRAGSTDSYAGYFYYSGRRWANRGALHAPAERILLCHAEHVSDGDVIGLLVDMDAWVAIFAHNGRSQGLCVLDDTSPFYLSTSLDGAGDRVELRRLPLAEAPKDVLAAHREITVKSCCTDFGSDDGG